jgi:hypothetical protein
MMRAVVEEVCRAAFYQMKMRRRRTRWEEEDDEENLICYAVEHRARRQLRRLRARRYDVP